jgi:hypothetical protein
LRISVRRLGEVAALAGIAPNRAYAQCDVLRFAKIPKITNRNEGLNVFGLWLLLADGGTIRESVKRISEIIRNS